MKLTIVLLLFFTFQVQAKEGDAQKITIVKSQIHLAQVFKSIEKQTGYLFFYDKGLINRTAPINLSVRDATLDQVLQASLRDQDLDYSLVGKTVVIRENRSNISMLAAPELTSMGMKITPPPVEIRGRVTDQQGNPLANVSVIISGTTSGTTTDEDGRYTLTAQDNRNVSLEFSSVGYVSQTVAVGNRRDINVVLVQENTGLDEVVVTALGIERSRKSLGYSVTEVKGEDLTQAREVNIMNSLSGKVAGLNVSSIAGGPGSSANVIIRGISSLGGTNQPLYVINGVPMENQINGVGGGQYDSGEDLGDGIGNLNPDDIESISVLKGAAASALYGYRAKGGVILITTKSAKSGEGGVEFNSSFVSSQIIDFTDWQYVYGQGLNNAKPHDAGEAFETGQFSWGDRLDGSNVVQFDGVERPYIAQKNNRRRFYRTGGNFTNNIAFNKAFEGGGVRLSATNTSDRSVMPNSNFNRQNFDLSSHFDALKRLDINIKASYIREHSKNRPLIGDTPGNADYGTLMIANSTDINSLRPRIKSDGSELGISTNTFATNPWFAAYEFNHNTNRDRLISSLDLKYNFDNNFFIQARTGLDFYNDNYFSVTPSGTAYDFNGSMVQQYTKFTDLNIDALIGNNINISDKIGITPNIGASYRRTKSQSVVNSGSNFAVPFVYNILNTKTKSVDVLPSDLEVQSVYGTLEFSYDSYLYLNGSLRSDWFSTLATPGFDNKLNVTYPSINASFVFSEFLNDRSFLNFGKLRAGYATVGQATTPYQTQLGYGLESATFHGNPLGTIVNSSVPNSGLRPSKASEFEIGTEVRLLNNRINIDLTWYYKTSKDEIIPTPASITSGYTSATLNIGELANRGVEALISFNILNANAFKWDMSLNGSVNKNKVIKLAEDQSQLLEATSRSGVGFISNIVGLPAAQVMAYDYKYDDAGEIVLDDNGIPARGELIPFGSAYSKWVGGWNNVFSFKRFQLSFLIDGKFGGKIFSTTDYNANRYGLLKATLVGREEGLGKDNSIDARTYYTTLGSNVSKQFVLDASFIKFRQFSVSYSFPTNIFKGKIKQMNFGIQGRDLFYLMKKTDNISPEASYSSTSSGMTYGIENTGFPPTRSYGVKLGIQF